MSQDDNIVADTAARIFADLGDPGSINRLRDGSWKAPLWQALVDAGLTLAWVPEPQGGSGASLADGFEVVAAAGRWAAAVPLVETLLGGWLLSRAGLPAPSGSMTVAPVRPSDKMMLDSRGCLTGTARGIPFGAEAEEIVVLARRGDDFVVARVNAADCRISQRRNLAGDPCDTIALNSVRPAAQAPAPPDLDLRAFMIMGATARSLQIAGALATILGMCVRYANERVAFERPIGKFQAVQHNLARLAGETAAALTAAGSAADAIANATCFEEGIFLEAASAKIRCAQAATEGAAIAHQVFGAIGFTQEHVLHRFTLRMLGWRDDFGNESHWATELGGLVARRGAEAFWPLIASR